MKKINFIILSGGVGSRTNLAIPKQYYKFKDKDSIDILLSEIEKLDFQKNIFIVAQPEWKDYVLQKNSEIIFVESGATRNETIINGFKSINNASDIVMIDAARPFVKAEQFREIIEGGVNAVFASTFPSVIYEKKGDKLTAIHAKEKYMIAETPHYYSNEVVSLVIEKFNENHLDLPQVLLEEGVVVKVLNSSFWRIKVTTEEDVENVKKIID